MIPFLDLKALNAPMQADIDAAVERVARSGRYVLGPEVEAFESEWAKYCGMGYCVGVGNGLDALQLILMALGVGPGDEVIVPANTYIATWLAVSHVGAVPVPVEPHPMTYNINVDRVRAAVTPRTAAILAVHLYGRCADMQGLRAVAVRSGLALIADAAQAHGAHHQTDVDAAAFSFYPTKNLGALGDAGAVVTNDFYLSERVRRLRHYGRSGRHRNAASHFLGRNSRLDEIQAAVLRAKLPHLDRLNSGRRVRAAGYSAALADTREIAMPLSESGNVYHQFVIRAADRDRLQATLACKGIETHVHYPVPPHLEPVYESLKYSRGAFPLTEQLAGEILSLPIGNEINTVQVGAQVAAAAKSTEPAHA